MIVENPSEWAVFLDLDGTLIDIAPTPRLVSVPPDLAPLLARLCVTLRGALAIVTGRQIGDVDRFLIPFVPSLQVCMARSYGLNGTATCC